MVNRNSRLSGYIQLEAVNYARRVSKCWGLTGRGTLSRVRMPLATYSPLSLRNHAKQYTFTYKQTISTLGKKTRYNYPDIFSTSHSGDYSFGHPDILSTHGPLPYAPASWQDSDVQSAQ